MSLTLSVLALLGCRTGRPPALPLPTAEDDSSSSSATGRPVWIEPSVQIRGLPGQEIDRDFAPIPAYGGHPGTLFVYSGAQPEPYPQTFAEYPRMFVLSGALPHGEHLVTEVWDGTSGVPFLDTMYTAGDVDQDGHMDVWAANRSLYRGPFVDRELSEEDVLAEAECCWMPILGNFDADGDGVLDALLGQGQNAQIYYGPLTGTLPLWGDNPDITIYGFQENWNCGTRGAFIVADYFAPGVDAIGVGAGHGDGCGIDTRFYELTGPRGRRLTFEDAFAVNDSGRSDVTHFYGLDVDGDGTSEVLYGTDRYLHVYENPIQPWFRDTPIAWDVGRFVSDVVGDVNGDGLDDIVAEIEDEDGLWYGLVLAPFDTTRPIDAEVAIPLTDAAYAGIGEEAVDLDGDGLSDLVDIQRGPDAGGLISIWYGADILAAIDSRRTP